MRIYIDEAGSFVIAQTPSSSYSLVLALIIPSTNEAQLFFEFMRLRDSWPEQQIEVKGRTLNETQAAQIIELVASFDVVAEFVALDLASHTREMIEDFKNRQADAFTVHITPEHQPEGVHEMQALASKMRSMPNQLFVQAFLTIKLVLTTIQVATLYYAQRLPDELGDISWLVDRKGHNITEMETIWTTSVLPFGESFFAKRPLITLREADYSHFHRRYSTKVKGEIRNHLEWMDGIYGVGHLSDEDSVVDAKRLLTEQRQFVDSRESLGIQLADMLSSILRRALNGRLQPYGWKDFGKLLVKKRKNETWFVQFDSGDTVLHLEGQAREVGLALRGNARPMLV
jgi:hypothetical protein